MSLIKNKKEDKYCQNCTNNRRHEFIIDIGGYSIRLCKQCWIGFALGVKRDFEFFLRDEDGFRRATRQTKAFLESDDAKPEEGKK